VAITLARAAAASDAAAQCKEIKYAEIAPTHLFYPSAFETMGPINVVGLEFISDLGHRISRVIDDPRKDFISVPTHFSCHTAFQRSHFFKFFLPHR